MPPVFVVGSLVMLDALKWDGRMHDDDDDDARTRVQTFGLATR